MNHHCFRYLINLNAKVALHVRRAGLLALQCALLWFALLYVDHCDTKLGILS
jgi:hypothetical protein